MSGTDLARRGISGRGCERRGEGKGDEIQTGITSLSMLPHPCYGMSGTYIRYTASRLRRLGAGRGLRARWKLRYVPTRMLGTKLPYGATFVRVCYYAHATRCPVLTYDAIGVPPCCEMPGTDLGHRAL
eukprot:2999256-Rhodomonas_salina.1